MKKTIKTDVVKRRLKFKRKPTTEPVSTAGMSAYSNLVPPQYYDSDVWAAYEAGFSEYARNFYSASNGDMYNHDALDLDIGAHFKDEFQHYVEQKERNLQVLDLINSGIIKESVLAQKRLEQVGHRLDDLHRMLEEHQEIYNTYERKAGC